MKARGRLVLAKQAESDSELSSQIIPKSHFVFKSGANSSCRDGFSKLLYNAKNLPPRPNSMLQRVFYVPNVSDVKDTSSFEQKQSTNESEIQKVKNHIVPRL